MKPETKAFVEQCEARASKATPGPWAIRCDEADPDDPPDTIYAVRSFGPWVYVEHQDADTFATKGDVDGLDADFIVHARVDLPEALRIIREQDAEIERLRARIEEYRDADLERALYR